MRQLTLKQKKMLDAFFDSRIEKDELKVFDSGTYFKNGDYSIGIDEMNKYDDLLMAKLEQVNDCEILYQNVDRYLEDKSSAYIHTK